MVTLPHCRRILMICFLVMLVAPNSILRAAVEPDSMVDLTPAPLRQGSFPGPSEIELALALRVGGWIYVIATHDYIPAGAMGPWMTGFPEIKWTLGFWYNHQTKEKSVSQPKRMAGGNYAGDGGAKIPQVYAGRSPPPLPTRVEWMCSRDGGPSQLVRARADREFREMGPRP